MPPSIIKSINHQFTPIKSLDDLEYFENQFVEFDYESSSDQFAGIKTLYGLKTRYAYIGANIVKSVDGEQGCEFKIFSDINDVQPRKLFTEKNLPSKLFFRVLNAYEVEEIKRLLDEKKAAFDIDPDEERYLAHSINVDMKRLKVYQHFSNYPTYFQSSVAHFTKLPERSKLFAKMEQLLDQGPVHRAALVGMTGSGKTVLAKQYMHTTDDKYIFKAYFNAQDKAALHADYIKLAEQQDIPYPKDGSIDQQMLAIKAWLESQVDSLFVYDNLMDETSLEAYLPSGSNHVLLISKNRAILAPFRVVKLADLSMSDAKKLMEQTTSNANVSSLEQLINKLGCLPLALVQAGTYMEKHSRSGDGYLSLMNNAKLAPQVLSYDHFYPGQEHVSVWSAFDEDLKNIQQQSPLAFMLLQQLCRQTETWIPKKLFPTLIDKSDVFIETVQAIHHLNRYSLLEYSQDSAQVKINPLLKMLVLQKYPLLDKVIVPAQDKLVFADVDGIAVNANTFFAMKTTEPENKMSQDKEDSTFTQSAGKKY